MATEEVKEIADGIVKDLLGLGAAGSKNVPVKAIVLRAFQRGITKGDDVLAAVAEAAEQGKLTMQPGVGPSGLGVVTLTDAAY